MADDKDKEKRSGPNSLGHLLCGHDTRTPEQVAKENFRRKGRRTKDWWKKYPPTDIR